MLLFRYFSRSPLNAGKRSDQNLLLDGNITHKMLHFVMTDEVKLKAWLMTLINNNFFARSLLPLEKIINAFKCSEAQCDWLSISGLKWVVIFPHALTGWQVSKMSMIYLSGCVTSCLQILGLFYVIVGPKWSKTKSNFRTRLLLGYLMIVR